MKKINAILLDLDNTLYDYNLCNNHANNILLEIISKEYKISLDKTKLLFEEARQIVKKNNIHKAYSHSRFLYFKEMLKLIGLKNLNELNKKSFVLESIFWNEFFSKMTLNKEAIKFLELCVANKVKICILSDMTTDIQVSKISYLGLDKYVDFLVTSEEVGIEKPNPRIFEYALNKISEKNSSVLMIGDDYERDILGSKKVGINSIQIKSEKDWELAKKDLESKSLNKSKNI